jgi:hypothetical protein
MPEYIDPATILRRLRRDRMRAKLKMIKTEMWRRMHQPIPKQGQWTGTGRPRLLQLPRSADKRSCTCRVPSSYHRPLAAHAAASQPEGSDDLGTDDAAGGRLAPETDHSPSLAERSLCRHTPEVGAVCGKAARTALCGGREVTRVPTASTILLQCMRPVVCTSRQFAGQRSASVTFGVKRTSGDLPREPALSRMTWKCEAVPIDGQFSPVCFIGSGFCNG